MILFHSYVIAADGLNDFFAQDAVLTIPGRPEWPDSGSSFDGSNQSHRDQMWTARVVLIFRCKFQGPGQTSPITRVLALVNRLRRFTAPQARKLSSASTQILRAESISVLQRGCFKHSACPCFMTVILSLT
jgi:hypothetical protein